MKDLCIRDWLEVPRRGTNRAARHGQIGLSFDDGPNGEETLTVLKELKRSGFKASFMWIVDNACKLEGADPLLFQEIVDGVIRDGHEIALHAPYDYLPNWRTRLFGPFEKEEMNLAKGALWRMMGVDIDLYRPHCLHLGPQVRYARELGMKTVLGSLFVPLGRPVDEQRRCFMESKAGEILIFHDGVSIKHPVSQVNRMLRGILTSFKERGLEGEKVSKVLD